MAISEEGYRKMIYFHLPGLFEFYDFYSVFLPLFREHREYFYDWCEIGSIYGAPADCLWGGGRAGFGECNAKVVLKPNSSVGWHRHVGETEPYYILEGEGIFVDDDGSRTKVGPGDVCTILPGQCHAIENASSCKDLAFMALIHKD